MSNTILIKRRGTPGVPAGSGLQYGELAINYSLDSATGRRLYFKGQDDNVYSFSADGQGTVKLNNILAADATNTIANGNNSQVWNWQLTGTNTAFRIGETAASTGAGTLFHVATTNTSAADPFRVSIGSDNLLHVKASGAVDILGRSGIANGGDVALFAGDGTSSGGDLLLYAGDGPAAGNVQILAGDGATPGDIDLVGGDSSGASKGGDVTVTSGTSFSGEGGDVRLFTTVGTLGGDVAITTGNGTAGRGGNVTITTGTGTTVPGKVTVAVPTSGEFEVTQGGTRRLYVNSSGNVGIAGVASPIQALDVNGSIRLTGSVYFAGDNTVMTSANLNGLNDVVITSPAVGAALTFDGTNWIDTPKNSLLALNDLTDVDIALAAEGKVLRYTTGSWKDAVLAIADVNNLQSSLDAKLSLSGGTMTGTLVLSGAPVGANDAATKAYVDAVSTTVAGNLASHVADTDLHLTAAQNTFLDSIDYVDVNGTKTNGDVLSWTGTSWIASAPVTNLDGLSDVVITGAATGQVLRFNGTNWVNQTLVATDISNFNAAVTSQVNSLISTNVVQGYDADLAALAAIASTGIYVITGAGASTTREIQGTMGHVVVTNGTGVGGNPTVDLATVTNSGVGTFQKVTVDSYGRVTGTTAVVTADITALVNATYVNVTGDTMSGTLNMGNNLITGVADAVSGTDAVSRDFADTRYVNVSGDTMTGFLTLNADPTSALHAATKQYVDNIAAGVNAHQSVRAATTSALSVTYNNGTGGVGATLTATSNGAVVIDGVSLILNDRVLVKDQAPADLEMNGIYVVTQVGDGLTPYILTRATDFDNSPAGEIAAGEYVFVSGGSTLASTSWVQLTGGTIIVGTTDIVFTQFAGAGTYIAGAGLTLSGTTFNVGTASASRIVVNADDIDLATTGVVAGSSNYVTFDSYGRVTATNNRTLTAGSLKVSVTNGDFVAGNPTVDVVESQLTLDNIGGVLSITKGGTGQTTAGAAAQTFLDTILTAKGDILTHNGSDSVKLAVGTNGQFLKANSVTATGLEWSDVVDGGSF